MSDIKTILLHLDASQAVCRRLGALHELAQQLDARLQAVYAVLPLLIRYPYALSVDRKTLSSIVATEADSLQRARTAFERNCHAAGIAQMPWHQTNEDPVLEFERRAYAADLLVLAQHDPRAATASGVPPDFAATVLVETGKPGLVLPYVQVSPTIGRDVLVAWKHTPESARAVTAALPFLRRAQRVHVACWDEPRATAADSAAPVLELLRAHGVAAELHCHAAARANLAELLLSQAADLQVDLLVMGCYGHGRAREWALGGVTRTIFRSMTLPVLMAH